MDSSLRVSAVPGITSQTGPDVDLYAPGEDITVIEAPHMLQQDSGTSFATPLVSGVVAMMLNRDPTLNPWEVRDILVKTAAQITPASGGPAIPRLHAYRAVLCTDNLFPAEIISHGVWLYYRFCLSYREVEELLVTRGIVVTYVAIRKWCRKFGQDYANQLRRQRPRPGDKWHLNVAFLTSFQATEIIRNVGIHDRLRQFRAIRTSMMPKRGQ